MASKLRKKLRKPIAYLWSHDRRRSFSTRMTAAALLPSVSVALTVTLALLVLLAGLVPIGFTIASGVAVGAVPSAVGKGSASPAVRTLITALTVAALLYAFLQVLGPWRSAVVAKLSHRFDTAMNMRIMRSLTEPTGVSHLEDPDALNRVATARGFTGWGTAGEAIGPMATLTGNFLQAFIATIVLARFSLLIALFLMFVLLIARSIWRRETFGLVKVQTGQAHALRRSSYLRDLVLQSRAAKETRVFGLLPWISDQFTMHWSSAMDEVWADRRRGMKNSLMAQLLSWIPMSVVLLALARAAGNGDITVAEVSIYAMAVFNMRAIYEVGPLELQIEFGQATIPAMLGLDAVTAPARLSSDGADPIGLPRSMIRFENVAFRYPGAERDIFRGLEIQIRHGESLAIVGANGAGKTTLVKLLCRLYDTTAGRITVDGVDIRKFDGPLWQRRVGAIFQDFVRFPFSARDNIAFGDIDRLDDAAAIADAARRAGAEKIIDNLPNGWDTVLSRRFEGGADLSGGEWQRIALARAMMAASGDIGVLVLDEPTANLDVRSEAELYGRFLELTQGLTTIVISHRFSTVRQADRICVLEDGRAIEQGNHESLLASDGLYAHMFRLQAARFTEKEARE